MNTDALEAFAGKQTAAEAKKAAKGWHPLSFEDFVVPGECRAVVGIDQSLSACGVVHLVATPHWVRVMDAVKLTTDAGEASGHEANLRRFLSLTELLDRWAFGLSDKATIEVVHEAPPIGGGRIRSPESSMLAAAAVRTVAAAQGLCMAEMVQKQAHARLICGNRNAKKAEHHAALKRVAADLPVRGFDRITNEATRDALSVALHHLTREP